MKNYIFFLFSMLYALNVYQLYAQSDSKSVQQALGTKSDVTATAEAAANILFNPIIPKSQPIQANPYPTDSINNSAIEALFGAKGLNVKANYIQYLKNFYFYLEYVTKIEYGARLLALGKQKNVNITNNDWVRFINTLQKNIGSWQQVEALLFAQAITPDWAGLASQIQATSWQALTQTSFWQSLQNKITAASITKSVFWQHYLKYMISKSFLQDSSLLDKLSLAEGRIWSYIPNIETAYYHTDFTALRNASELFRLTIILTDMQRNRFLQQCTDWQTFADKKTGIFDLLKVYTATQNFTATPFYIIISSIDQPSLNLTKNITDALNSIKPDLLKQEPIIMEQFTCIAMIRNLQTLTHYLFDRDNLETTMAILANPAIKKPSPSILLYAPDDYIYLEDIVHMNDTTVAHAQIQAQSTSPTEAQNNKLQMSLNTKSNTVKTQSLSDLWNSAQDAWSDLKSGTAFGRAVQLGQDVVSEATSTGALKDPFGSISGLDPNIVGDMIKKGTDKALSKLQDAINSAAGAVGDIVGDVTDAANQVGEVGKEMGDMFANIDPEFTEAAKNLFVTLYENTITALSDEFNILANISMGVIRLKDDGIAIIAKGITDVIEGKFSSLGPDLAQGFKNLAEDVAISILETLSSVAKLFIDVIGNMLKIIAYLTTAITRLFIDIATAAAFVAGAFGHLFNSNIDPSEWANQTNATLNAHEEFINSIVETGLLLATIPLTGGASIPVLLFMVGPQVFGAIGAYQEEEARNQEFTDEQNYVTNFKNYVANLKIITDKEKTDLTNELDLKYQAEISNQERGLGFYTNYLNTSFENLKTQMAQSLGRYWKMLLSPIQPSGLSEQLIPGDVGSLYGFQTGVYELNPSLGFSIWNNARKSFSQEIAVNPAPAIKAASLDDQKSQLNPNQKPAFQNWFNQKEIMPLDSTATDFEIRFKPISVLNNHYIGLYIGGKPIIPAVIDTTGIAPIDHGYLAKMIVYKQEPTDTKSIVGVYQHEAAGWINEPFQGPDMTLGIWYHIKAHIPINGNTLQFKIWEEPNAEPSSWQSCTITPSNDQITLGVISSGAVTEYQFISPTPTITAIKDIRSDESSMVQEVTREQSYQVKLNRLMKPTIEKLSLTPVGLPEIVKQQYIYMTPATNLQDMTGKALTDYVVPVQIISDQQGNADISSGTLGIEPQPGDPNTTYGVVSLVSEMLFDCINLKSYNVTKPGTFNAYTSVHGPLSDSLNTSILNARSEYIKSTLAIPWGALTLQAINQTELSNGHYIYTTSFLYDKNGNLVKDASNKPIFDYFVVAQVDNSQNQNAPNPIGISYQQVISDPKSIYGIFSFISGNFLSKTGIISSGWSGLGYWRQYKTNNKSLSKDTISAIENAQAAYKSSNTKTAQTSSSSSSSTSSNDVSQGGGQTPGGNQGQPTQPAQQSLQLRSVNASGSSGPDFSSDCC